MSDTTDLSKLSSTEIIGKIAELAVAYDGVWIIESIAKLHVLTVVLKQAIVREASVGLCYAMPNHPHDADEKTTTLATTYRLLPGAYKLIPKETI